ncbi:MAG TPA: pirin family protein [Thermoanaerobaculia bacterium]|nr:pirin family protein [Thermoanaerobaculia bacterium]
MNTFSSRSVETIVRGTPASDGAGVQLLRVLGQNLQRRLDPFLMLDEFRSDDPNDYGAGFPDHPHRGFETVTYMLAGRMRHKDNAGHEGLLATGGVQWMTAGRGVIHSEMPEQENGLMHGFQLWLNLPSGSKMIPAWYRDIAASEIPEITTEAGVMVKVVAGTANGATGAMSRETTEPLYLDVHLPAGASYDTIIDPEANSFVYVYEGEIEAGSSARHVSARQMALLGNEKDTNGVTLRAITAARALIVAGRPLREPIAQYGPFVMNTTEELEQAFHDYRSGRF